MLDASRCEQKLQSIKRQMRACGTADQFQACLDRLAGWQTGDPESDVSRCSLYGTYDPLAFTFRIDVQDRTGQYCFAHMGRLEFGQDHRWHIRIPGKEMSDE